MSAFVMMRFVLMVAVPAEMVRSSNVLSAASIVMLAVASKVTMPVPCVYVDPTPDVSQLPETVHAPVVTVMIPDAPPVIVTLASVAVVAFAVRMPPLPTFSAPVLRPRPAVASSVVDTPSLMLRVPAQRRARVDIVNVCAVPPVEEKVTLLK